MNIILMLLLIFTSCAQADLIIVKDYGGRPTHIPSDSALQTQRKIFLQSLPNQAMIVREPAQHYPLFSSMTLGFVARTKHNKPIAKPFFILSTEPQSIAWINVNKETLSAMGAFGIATNIHNSTELKALKDSANPLPIYAFSIEDIIHHLPLHHYPVLITTTEIMQ